MSIEDQVLRLNVFSSIGANGKSTNKSKKKKKNITFHETLEGKKKTILDFYERQPYFREIMPTILRNHRGIEYYKKMIEKGLEGNSEFFRNLLKAIKKSCAEGEINIGPISKTPRYYLIPKLELLKRRNKKVDIYLENKRKKIEKDKLKFRRVLKKSNSMPDEIGVRHEPHEPSFESIMKSTFNENANVANNRNTHNNTFFNNTVTADTFHTNNKKNESLMDFKNKLTKNKNLPPFFVTNHSSRNKTIFNLKDIFKKSHEGEVYVHDPKLENIINQCKVRLNAAENAGTEVEKLDKDKGTKEINRKFAYIFKSPDQLIIEDRKIFGNPKYKKLEIEKFKELKKRMDIKVSNGYAYRNRKNFIEEMKENGHLLAYQLFSREMELINEQIMKQKNVEKKNISTVETLLENTVREKELAKYQMEKFFKNQKNEDEMKLFYMKNKDLLFTPKNLGKKTSIVNKLFELKDYCYGRPKYKVKSILDSS